MSGKTRYKTVVISDVHLGSAHARLQEVTHFLGSVDCDLLILNGDIIDGWQLKSCRDKWTSHESDFFKAIMDMMENSGTDVVYVAGNHDDFLDSLIPSRLFNIQLVNEYIIDDKSGRYVVIHGHAFDSITAQFRWLSKLGDVAYSLLLKFNNAWNRHRARMGREPYSFSRAIKGAVKKAVNFLSWFEMEIADFARAKKCTGIICGHIHHPEDKIIRHGIHYLNSGDWVESLTALVESGDGKWEVIYYKDLFRD